MIFRRIFIVYAAVVLLAGLVTETYVTSAVRDDHINNLKRHSEDKITLISREISFTKGTLDRFCRGIKDELNTRVTVILNDGKVIGDSDRDSLTMDNHLERTEVQQAASFGTGMTIRHSETMDHDFLYVAKKVTTKDGGTGFIRLAVPLQDIDRAVNLLRLKVVLVVGLVLLVTWGGSVWQTDHLRRLLGQIAAFSRALSRGELDKRLFLNRAGEFSEIADNLTSMSVTIQGMMSQNDEEKNRLNVILRSVPDALLIIDAKGIVTLSSSSAKDFFGAAPAAGTGFADVVRNHEFSALIEEVRKTLTPGMTELSVGTDLEKHLAIRVSPLFYKGSDLSGFVAVFHDITEIKKLEQVRKDFVANVSHELKTPITAIMGFSDTLLEGAIDDREHAVKFIRTIRANSERINSIVDDLMTISKIELGVIRVEKSMVDINNVFENIMDLFGDKAAAKNITLSVRNRHGISGVSADRDRLVQILTNLVDNAIKYTDTGGVIFGIDREGAGAELFVEDTGVGVPAKYLSRLGERFFRVDPARSRKMGGTGLGLAIVKHLVKAHGWNIHFESRPGKGTKVRISLT
ncbi:MAG: PAS domain S-box protein [Nitrospirae bacterium]|nr:PAS domain S-box protein [Nitrospirota bacterium]